MDEKTKQILKQLGFGEEIFPQLKEVQNLKKQGMSIKEIAKLALEKKISVEENKEKANLLLNQKKRNFKD